MADNVFTSFSFTGIIICLNPLCIIKDKLLNVDDLSSLDNLTHCPHNHCSSDIRKLTWYLTHKKYSTYLGDYNGGYALSNSIRGMLYSHNIDDTHNITWVFKCVHPSDDLWQDPTEHQWEIIKFFPHYVGLCYVRNPWSSYYQYVIQVIVGKTTGCAYWYIKTHHPYW